MSIELAGAIQTGFESAGRVDMPASARLSLNSKLMLSMEIGKQSARRLKPLCRPEGTSRA